MVLLLKNYKTLLKNMNPKSAENQQNWKISGQVSKERRKPKEAAFKTTAPPLTQEKGGGPHGHKFECQRMTRSREIAWSIILQLGKRFLFS